MYRLHVNFQSTCILWYCKVPSSFSDATKCKFPKVPNCEPSLSLNCKVSLWRGDISTLELDAIVNTCNPVLRSDSMGVSDTIHQAAGPLLRKECNLYSCIHGDAILTCGYNLPAKCKYLLRLYMYTMHA